MATTDPNVNAALDEVARKLGISREEALKLVERDNRPRFDSMQWYFDTIGLDMTEALKIIRKIPRLY